MISDWTPSRKQHRADAQPDDWINQLIGLNGDAHVAVDVAQASMRSYRCSGVSAISIVRQYI
jgi:hypothetical protein